MIDPAEIAELRELFDDDWPTRVHIETMTDGIGDYCGKATCGPVHHTGDSDADTEAVLRDMRRLEAVPKPLDAAERCARLEALLREALPLIQRAADGEYFDAWSDGRAKRLLDRTNAELQPAAQLDAADRERREDEQRDDHDDGA